MPITLQTEHDWTVHSINIHGLIFERWCQQAVQKPRGGPSTPRQLRLPQQGARDAQPDSPADSPRRSFGMAGPDVCP
jgi:hypothetical protein